MDLFGKMQHCISPAKNDRAPYLHH